MTVLLSGVVGSTAYGLAQPGSDIDLLGVFAASTRDILALTPVTDTITGHNPDTCLHEAGKFARLALNGNPTVTELLWLDTYDTRTADGDALLAIRSAFLSAPRVRDAYLGYATQQLRRAEQRTDGTFSADTRNRTAKHARHLARLVNQGYELYTTGHLTVRVTNPDWYHEFGDADPTVWRIWLDQQTARFATATTALPDSPHVATVENWLLTVRARHWTPPNG